MADGQKPIQALESAICCDLSYIGTLAEYMRERSEDMADDAQRVEALAHAITLLHARVQTELDRSLRLEASRD